MGRVADDLVLAFNELEDAVCQYLYEAHHQTLVDIVDCDHAAGVCWCGYKKSYENLLAALRRKPEIKSKTKSAYDFGCNE
jgi:hypothetical protein